MNSRKNRRLDVLELLDRSGYVSLFHWLMVEYSASRWDVDEIHLYD